jgi:phospholipid/cholesterol/gamma-HCH transport system substrate-binding protein
MSKQAQVGLFTILGIVAIFAVFYVLSDIGPRTQGYKIGVRFASASGLRSGANVSLSGVPIGAVDSIALQPDYSTDVVLSIRPGFEIPNGSRFLIQAPLTGEPTVLIEPPRDLAANAPTLPHEVLPIDQQPRGTNPTSIGDLLAQGQGEVKRLDDILSQLQRVEPTLLAELSSSLRNANHLTEHADQALTHLGDKVDVLSDSLQRSLTAASTNVVELTGTLNKTASRDSVKVDDLLTGLERTSKSFGETVDSLHDVATNPRVKQNLIDTTRDFALTAKTFAELTGDLRNVTSNPQTQAQLRDTVAQIDATTQKVDSLVGSFGGTSHVYGVDAGATPAPGGTPYPPGFVPTSMPAIPPTSAPGTGNGTNMNTNTTTSSRATGGPATATGLASLKARLDAFTKDLVELQVRASVLSPLRPGSYNRNDSPLLTADRGPQTDFNLFILPHAHTGLEAGFNDIGSGTSTGNLQLISRTGNTAFSGGILYSRLGGTASVAMKALGLEARFYDLRHPTLDSYLNIKAAKKFQIFGGERDISHAQRRTVFGLQTEF